MARKSAQESFEGIVAEIERLAKTAGDEAISDLIRYTVHPHTRVRLFALDRLLDHWQNGLSDGKLALAAVRAMTSDPAWGIRDTAVEALGDIGNRNDVHRLLIAAEDEEWPVRCSAAASLGLVGAKRAIQKVLRMVFEDRHPCVRMWAASAVGEIGDKAHVRVLQDAERREKHDLARTGILGALLLLRRSEYLDPYLYLLSSADRRVPSLVVRDLARLYEQGILPEPDKVRSVLSGFDAAGLDPDAHAAAAELLTALGKASGLANRWSCRMTRSGT